MKFLTYIKRLSVLVLLFLKPTSPYNTPIASNASPVFHYYLGNTLLSSSNNEEVVTTTLLFTGDINLGRCIAQTAIKAEDYAYPFRLVSDKLRAADITVGSLDSAISDVSEPMPCPSSMNLIGPENMVEGLKISGFDAITVATNHAEDCGEKGYGCKGESLLDTLATLNQAGIAPIGGGENLSAARQPVIIEKNGVRFAFIGINQINPDVWAKSDDPGVAPLSDLHLERVLNDIQEVKKTADVVIVLPQWGEEYSTAPADYQREWTRKFHEAGATLVVGNHAHLIQPIEEFHQGTTFYALGNFVFDQEPRARREGIAIEAIFSGSKLKEWKAHPTLINYYTYQTEWVIDEAEVNGILERAQILP